MTQQLVKFFSAPAYAVVGVSSNREKYGNIVYRYLKNKHFPVFPVNPGLSIVEGDTCYASIADLPDSVKSIVLVVHPEVSEKIVKECTAKGITGIWMQPGAESPDAIELGLQNGIAVIADACIMVLLAPVETIGGVDSWLENVQGAY